MINTIFMFFLVTQPFFDGNSVALATRTNSFFANPAGLAIHPGFEVQYNRTFTSLQNIMLDVGSIGFAARLKPDTTAYQVAAGLALGKPLSIGYGFGFGDTKVHTVGAIVRPGRYLSLGFTSEIKRAPGMQAGIGMRPLTDRVTFFFDASYRDSITGFAYGAGLEPINGLVVSFAGNNDNQFRLGLELSLGAVKVGGGANTDLKGGSVGFIVSGTHYPTFLPVKKRLVEITLEGDYPEDKEDSKLLGFALRREPAFYNLIHRLDELKDREDCAGLLINFKNFSLGLAQTEELRKVLVDLKEAGKKIFVFAYGYDGLKNYYLASVADQIILVPLGDVSIPGIMMLSPYLTGALEKLGIEADAEHIGKYKSAIEPLTRKDMSDADREQRSLIVDGVFSSLVETIAQARAISRDTLEGLIQQSAFFNPTEALANRLVDTVAFAPQLDQVIKARTGKSWSRQPLLKFVGREEVSRAWRDDKPKIALVIAEGDIVVGRSGNSPIPIPFLGGQYIGSETVSGMLKKVKDDPSIKAVVFRVNSGGGSALASEIITQALKQIKGKKPVIVSMGNVAGSGGYYIAAYGDRIFADPSTITGSIGILSVKLVTRGLYDKLGITWDAVKKGEHADAFSDLRHFTDDERARVQKELRFGYEQFLNRVADGRQKTVDYVDSVGQGRIWSGTKAKELGLVDEVGGLLDAIDAAKELAGLKDKEVSIAVYPAPENRFQLQFGINLPFGFNIEDYELLKMLKEPKLYLMDYGVEFGD
jgi:protease-4